MQLEDELQQLLELQKDLSLMRNAS